MHGDQCTSAFGQNTSLFVVTPMVLPGEGRPADPDRPDAVLFQGSMTTTRRMGPWAPMTTMRSMSAVRLGPVTSPT